MTSQLLANTELISALGWTILHSLWQATLLAGILWLASRLSTRAVARYRLAYGTLLLQLLLSIGTFAWLFDGTVQATTTETITVFFASPGPAMAEAGWWNPTLFLFWIVVFWVVGLLIGSVRLGLSFGRVRRMQRSVEGAVPEAFRASVAELAGRIGYHGPLHLRISDALSGPALVGHLKPMLLFPLAVVNQLTTEEAEAVILHELAHLKRQDHWWNLLQCLIEVLFYYHPVVWWIGARIREEREHCCDDLVLQHGPDRLAYAKALLYFEQQRSTPATAVALTNNPASLLGRVKRFLHQQNIPYHMKSRLFLLPLIALIALICTAAYVPENDAFTNDPAPETSPLGDRGDSRGQGLPAPASAPDNALLGTNNAIVDSLPSGSHKITSYRNGSSTEVIVEDRAIKELIIDGKVIPPAEYSQHEEMVERMLGTSESRRGRYFFHNDEGDNFYLEDDAISPETLRGLEGLRGLESLEGLKRLEDLKSLEGLESLQFHFEDMGDNWEALGERLGEMGERLGRSFEGFFDLGDGRQRMEFHWNGEDGQTHFFDTDSLPPGSSYRFNSDDKEGIIILDGKVLRSGDAGSKVQELQEMETMIQKLERRKAELQRELENGQRTQEELQREEEGRARVRELMQRDEERLQRELERSRNDIERAQIGTEQAMRDARNAHRMATQPDYEDIIRQLDREGLIEYDAPVKKLALDNDSLKVNGKKASKEAHRRYLEIFRERYGNNTLGNDFSVKFNNN